MDTLWLDGPLRKLEMVRFGEITHTGETSVSELEAFDNWVGVTAKSN